MEKKLYVFSTIFWTFVAGFMLGCFLTGTLIPNWYPALMAGIAAWYAAILASKMKD